MADKLKRLLIPVAAVAALAVGGAAIAGAAGNDSSSQEPQSVAANEDEGATESEDEGATESEDEGADDSANDSEQPIAGSDIDQASAAALKATGGGQVTETEVGDEESYYEVEVTRDDGSQVDVQLDRSFNVVGSEADE
jgi:uncharacterized membrane protein YkoI